MLAHAVRIVVSREIDCATICPVDAAAAGAVCDGGGDGGVVAWESEDKDEESDEVDLSSSKTGSNDGKDRRLRRVVAASHSTLQPEQM